MTGTETAEATKILVTNNKDVFMKNDILRPASTIPVNNDIITVKGIFYNF